MGSRTRKNRAAFNQGSDGAGDLRPGPPRAEAAQFRDAASGTDHLAWLGFVIKAPRPWFLKIYGQSPAEPFRSESRVSPGGPEMSHKGFHVVFLLILNMLKHAVFEKPLLRKG